MNFNTICRFLFSIFVYSIAHFSPYCNNFCVFPCREISRKVNSTVSCIIVNDFLQFHHRNGNNASALYCCFLHMTSLLFRINCQRIFSAFNIGSYRCFCISLHLQAFRCRFQLIVRIQHLEPFFLLRRPRRLAEFLILGLQTAQLDACRLRIIFQPSGLIRKQLRLFPEKRTEADRLVC